MDAADRDNGQAQELAEAVRAIRDRVREAHPQGHIPVVNVPLPDLAGVLHARDRAEAKVASIGTVNPRPGGLKNAVIQRAKKLIARALDWHVREQIEFNRGAMDVFESLLAALNEHNRALVAVATSLQAEIEDLKDLRELRDMRSHWITWRTEWERKLSVNEIQFLRSVADLQAAYQHRATLVEANFRDLIRTQHSEFSAALEKAAMDIQKRLWEDMDRVRTEHERLIHQELRIVRQRAAILAGEPAPAPLPAGAPPLPDQLRFADCFRGPRDNVRESQRFYLPWFKGRKSVLDIGCGRGEFLEIMKDAGAAARGIDLSGECVALCRAAGLEAEVADLFEWLAAAPPDSLDGIFCAQVVEHLPPERLPEFIRLSAAALERGGLIVVETPNPECLAIFATHFYLDPTHVKPVPHALMAFYLQEAGFGNIEVLRRSPAVETLPELAQLPDGVRASLFDGLDYAISARRL